MWYNATNRNTWLEMKAMHSNDMAQVCGTLEKYPTGMPHYIV